MQLNFNSKKSPKEKNSKKELSSNQSSQEKPLSNITPQGLQTDTQNPLGEQPNATENSQTSSTTSQNSSSQKQKKEDAVQNYKKQVALKKAQAKQERLKQKRNLNIHTQEQFEATQLRPFRNWSILFLLSCLFFGIKSFTATYTFAGIVSMIQVLCFLLTIIVSERKLHFFNKDYLLFFLLGIFLTPVWLILAII